MENTPAFFGWNFLWTGEQTKYVSAGAGEKKERTKYGSAGTGEQNTSLAETFSQKGGKISLSLTLLSQDPIWINDKNKQSREGGVYVELLADT